MQKKKERLLGKEKLCIYVTTCLYLSNYLYMYLSIYLLIVYLFIYLSIYKSITCRFSFVTVCTKYRASIISIVRLRFSNLLNHGDKFGMRQIKALVFGARALASPPFPPPPPSSSVRSMTRKDFIVDNKHIF